VLMEEKEISVENHRAVKIKPVKRCCKTIKCVHGVTIFHSQNVLDECRTTVIMKGSIFFIRSLGHVLFNHNPIVDVC
jgi:hypothetical protein